MGVVLNTILKHAIVRFLKALEKSLKKSFILHMARTKTETPVGVFVVFKIDMNATLC